MGVFVDAGMAGLNVEDPIATHLVSLFEDDDIESEEDAILGCSNAAGARADDANALVRNHDRLSLERVIFRRLQIIGNTYRFPSTCLILRRIDLPNKDVNDHARACRWSAGPNVIMFARRGKGQPRRRQPRRGVGKLSKSVIPSIFLRSIQENYDQRVRSVIRVAMVLGRKPSPNAAFG
jgi:hypothetical protein